MVRRTAEIVEVNVLEGPRPTVANLERARVWLADDCDRADLSDDEFEAQCWVARWVQAMMLPPTLNQCYMLVSFLDWPVLLRGVADGWSDWLILDVLQDRVGVAEAVVVAGCPERQEAYAFVAQLRDTPRRTAICANQAARRMAPLVAIT